MPLYVSGIVGGDSRLSTWGKFRVTLARNTRNVPVRKMFSREWASGLKASGDGSGWIRKPPTADNFNLLAAQDWQPLFIAGTAAYPDPPYDSYGYVAYRPSQPIRPTASEELVAYLSGDVSTDGGNANMNSAFWANSGYVVSSPATTVYSVDGLTDF